MSQDLTPATTTAGSEDDAFLDPVAMEDDPTGCFPGDRGVLDAPVRRVLVRLLRNRFLHSVRHREDWTILMDNQQVIESRLHDLFIRLIVDADRGVAYKQQVRSEEADAPILLRDEPYSRAETLVLVYLRTVYQRESTAGERAAMIDIEDVEQTVLSYFTQADRETARRQTTIRKALERLSREGIIDQGSEGRYLITPLVEIVLSADRLRDLDAWLRQQSGVTTPAEQDDEPGGGPEGEPGGAGPGGDHSDDDGDDASDDEGLEDGDEDLREDPR